MIRGTTPQHTFTMPVEMPNGTEYRIVYAQGEDYKENILFEVETKDCAVDGCKVSVRLTKEQTLLFDQTPHWQNGVFEPYPVKIQLGAKTPGGETLWSRIITTTVERCLRKDGVV